MHLRFVAFTLLLLFASPINLISQNFQGQKHGFSMKLWINNVGAMGRVAVPPFRPTPNPPFDSIGLEYPIGTRVEHLFGAGLWIGGISQGRRLVTVIYEGWAGPYFEMFPGSSPEDTLYALHNASRRDTVRPPGWDAYWGGALPFRPISDQDIYYTYTDTAVGVSGHIPLRVKVIQSSHAWNDPYADAVIIFEYKIMNNGVKLIDSAYIGFFVEGDVGPINVPNYFTRNYSAYYPNLRTAYTHNPIDLGSTPFGLRLLGASRSFDSLGITFQWFPGPNTPPDDAAKYALLSSRQIRPDEYPSLSDTRFVLATGPFTLRPGIDPNADTIKLAVAIVSGLTLSLMQQNAIRADSLYRGLLTSVEQTETRLPERFELYQNYPNPFNPVTVISFQLPVSSFVSLKVYNLLGQEVATLANEEMMPGRYELTFDGTHLPSGVYFYRLTAGNFSATKKLLLLK